MTTNKPEVKRYNMTTDKYDHPVPYETEHGQWVKYSSYKALQAECEKLRKDAERYQWLRMADWWDSPLCAVRNPAKQVKPGSDCPSRDRLDDTIDAATQEDNPCQT